LPELDDDDLSAIQVFKLNAHKNNAVATCRIFQTEGEWMLGRVAVAQDQRGTGLGSRLMRAVHAYLQMRGVDALFCHAQLPAQAFYEQLGYETVGTPFDEGGIQHVLMKKSLR
jgi:predicted GNAT family N-acyltransferase